MEIGTETETQYIEPIEEPREAPEPQYDPEREIEAPRKREKVPA